MSLSQLAGYDCTKSMLPDIPGTITAVSGGSYIGNGGDAAINTNDTKAVVLFGEPIDLDNPAKMTNETMSNSQKRVSKLLNLDTLDIETKRSIITAIYHSECNTNSKLSEIGGCEPLRSLITALAVQLLGITADKVGNTGISVDAEGKIITLTINIPIELLQVMLGNIVSTSNTSTAVGVVDTGSVTNDANIPNTVNNGTMTNQLPEHVNNTNVVPAIENEKTVKGNNTNVVPAIENEKTVKGNNTSTISKVSSIEQLNNNATLQDQQTGGIIRRHSRKKKHVDGLTNTTRKIHITKLQ